ncbi:MAG: serine O-acetyltransferase [Myxococcales bacterium]|nr:serine O-acetyltransferase [Myxococcales bacterium]
MAIQRRTAPKQPYLRLADRILKAQDKSDQSNRDGQRFGTLPSPADIGDLIDDLLAVLFPGWGRTGIAFGTEDDRLREHIAAVLVSLERRAEDAVFLGLRRRCAIRESEETCRARAHEVTQRFLASLPEVRRLLVGDIDAAYRADPAATGTDEIVSCYPGLYAIAVYRAAHSLLGQGAPIVPRMMTEHAHARTGIDIHPGARIGPAFFIDHGTGIVVGETSLIGANVRIYQGVTLGALSVKDRQVEAPGRKRHPTIEDDVVIYANATILGGTTVIGRGAVVGGNAWITYSVPPGVRVGVGM